MGYYAARVDIKKENEKNGKKELVIQTRSIHPIIPICTKHDGDTQIADLNNSRKCRLNDYRIMKTNIETKVNFTDLHAVKILARNSL